MVWPFNILNSSSVPPPQEGERAAGGYTDLRVGELERIAGGVQGAETLAAAQASVSWWERSCAALMVEDGNDYTASLTPHLLAIAARSLAVYGNSVFVIDAIPGGVVLLPASSYDVTGGPDPATWSYRCDLVGSTRTEVRRVSSAGVLHFRVGQDRSEAWYGIAPLRRSSLTAILARRLEVALADECTVPITRLLGMAGQKPGAERVMAALDHRAGTAGLSVYQGPENGRPNRVGPEPTENEVTLREQIAHQVYALFGISPLLFSTDADGQSLREAKRLFLSTTLRGLVSMIEAELAMKLMAPGVRLSMGAMFITDEETMALSVSRRSSAFAKLIAGGVESERALKLAGLGD